jgi:hypothetical protein
MGMERKVFWTSFTILGLVADFALPLWWALAATIPLGVLCWWLAYRSGWIWQHFDKLAPICNQRIALAVHRSASAAPAVVQDLHLLIHDRSPDHLTFRCANSRGSFVIAAAQSWSGERYKKKRHHQ